MIVSAMNICYNIRFSTPTSGTPLPLKTYSCIAHVETISCVKIDPYIDVIQVTKNNSCYANIPLKLFPKIGSM